eukprot:COSAG06_NODE_858_length_11909_cov_6.018036_1_plen_49_part_00
MSGVIGGTDLAVRGAFKGVTGTCSGEYTCHASEIQIGWSPHSERSFER